MNVRGIRNKVNRLALFRHICRLKLDVCMIQEAYITDEDVTQWQLEWGGKLFAVPHTNRSRGLVILLKENMNIKHVEIIDLPDTADRIQMVMFEFGDRSFCMINVYAPNDEVQKIAFFKKLKEIVCKNVDQDKYDIILGGDFNAVLDNSMDNISGKDFNNGIIKAISAVLIECGLVDSWRKINNHVREFTWKRNAPYTARRLDYMLITERMMCK